MPKKLHLIDWSSSIPEPRHEMFNPNTWYGGAAILKNYANWRIPLPLVVPHGIVFSSTFKWEAEIESGLPAVYCFPDFRANSYAESGKLKVVKGASPWAYLLKMMPRKRERKGTVVFPAHSTHHVKVIADDKKYAKYLAGLSPKLKPIRVCLYWRDIELGRHQPFSERGFDIVTAGHMYRENFLERLYFILMNCEYVMTPELGSHIFYATAMGCTVILQEEFISTPSGDCETLKRDCPNLEDAILNPIKKAFVDNGSRQSQLKITETMLGIRNVKKPMALKVLFLAHYFKNPKILFRAMYHSKQYPFLCKKNNQNKTQLHVF